MNLENIYETTVEEEVRVKELLESYPPGREDDWFHPDYTKEYYLPVEDGEIRVFHHLPKNSIGRRPVVFLAGWGTTPEGFRNFFDVVNDRIEYYYIETREKNSSRLDRSRAQMGMDQQAQDVERVLQSELQTVDTGELRDFVLIGTCWGSTILAHGLARNILSAPTAVLFDPMHTLWFPKWLLKWVVPLTPLWLWNLIRPLGKRIALRGMDEPTQRRRAELFIDNATLWKWKRSGLQVQNVDLYRSMPQIRQEVLVMNGVRDKIHDPQHYPRLAALIPEGRFFYLPVDESQREQLLGLASVLFAQVTKDEGLPEELRGFERSILRGMG